MLRDLFHKATQDAQIQLQVGNLESGTALRRIDHLRRILVATNHQPTALGAHVDACLQ
jgi:hypothetical protein